MIGAPDRNRKFSLKCENKNENENENENLNYYLAGLWEGDGHIEKKKILL
jgi:hypothetical protein